MGARLSVGLGPLRLSAGMGSIGKAFMVPIVLMALMCWWTLLLVWWTYKYIGLGLWWLGKQTWRGLHWLTLVAIAAYYDRRKA